MESEWLSSNGKPKPGQNCYLVGLYGWRRRCLLFTLSILLVLVIVNLTLSLWMLKVLNFSLNGPGALKVSPGGINLRGEAMVLDNLVSSKISSRTGRPIQIESSKNISLLARSSDSRVNSKIFLGDDKLNVMASSLKIVDSRSRLVFSVDKKDVLVGAEMLRFSGDLGANFYGSVQTPTVKSEAGKTLKLESPTRSLNVFALHGVNLESRAGDINADCLTDFKVNSKIGSVKFDAPNIYLPRVPTATINQKASLYPTSSNINSAVYRQFAPSQNSNNQKTGKSQVFQVCVCGKGRLFLAPAEGPCVADNDVCR